MAIGLRPDYWALALVLCACGAPQADNRAPQNQEEAGYILRGEPEEIETVLQKSSSYRVISKKHNIFEVRGLNKKTIEKIAPSLKIDRNLYSQNMIEDKPPEKTERVYLNIMANDVANSRSNLPKALIDCDLKKTHKPVAAIGLASDVLSRSVTMELGQTAHFSGAQSRSRNGRQPLQLIWDVIPPQFSALLPDQPQVSEEFEFKPDSVGTYQVVLVAKDSDQACDVKMIRFLVTHNPDLQSNPRPGQQKITTSNILHLQQISAEKSWQQSTGQDVIVAVLDTGLHYNHFAIQNNLALKSIEINSRFDNDNNGYAGDFLGWDFVNHDNKPFDDQGHGSHVAGLVSVQSVGSAPSAKIMPLKVLNAAGGGDSASIIAAIYYAVDNGAHVINASLQRLTTELDSLKEAIAYAQSKNVVFVSAAGNDSLDLSRPGVDIYPGEIDVPNVINVAAVNSRNQLTSYSNYGLGQVDLAAPGGDIFQPIHSLTPLNPLEIDSTASFGTSMAAPLVAGVVAQMIQANPNISSEEIKQILHQSSSPHSQLRDVVASGGVINAFEAVKLAEEMHLQNHIF